MEGDPSARIATWRSEGEGESQDGTPVHNSNPAINMPSSGADTSAGAARDQGSQEPSQASADWGDMGAFSMGPLEAPAFSGAEESQQPEQRQQHAHTTRYEIACCMLVVDLLEGPKQILDVRMVVRSLEHCLQLSCASVWVQPGLRIVFEITGSFIYMWGNPQPEAIGHSQTCLQPESGAGQSCTVCSLVNWEMTHS